MSNSYLIVYKCFVLFEALFWVVVQLDSRMLDSRTTEFLKNDFYILLKYIEIFDIIRYNKI